MGGAGGIFHFPFVANVFPLCSHQVFNEFTIGSVMLIHAPNMFPSVFPITPHFYPICFGKYCHPFPCIGGPKEKNFQILQNRIIKFWGVPIVLEVFGDGPIKPASCQKKRRKLGMHPI